MGKDLSLRGTTTRQEVPSQKGRWIAMTAMVIAPILGAGAISSVMAVDYPSIPNKAPMSPYTDIFLPKPPDPPKLATAKKVEVSTNEPSFPTEPPDKLYPEPPERPAAEPTPDDDKGRVDGDGDKGIKIDLTAPLKPEPLQEPVRPGNIRRPVKINDVLPVYPPVALQARVQGIVIVEATIGADGLVKDARVLRSIPLLDEAALAAVRQWQFTPTFLNNVPVPVIMTVTVQFTLQ